MHYSLSSARIFFRADLTAAEEDEQKEKEGTLHWQALPVSFCIVTTAAEGGNKPADGEDGDNSGQPPPPSDPGTYQGH